MTDDRFKALLRRADAQNEPALAPAAEMVRRVERAAHHQRRQRALACVVASPLVVVAVGWAAWRLSPGAIDSVRNNSAIVSHQDPLSAPHTPAGALTPEEVERALESLAATEAEANLHMQIARRLIAERERDATMAGARQAMADDEPAEAVRERLDLVAYRMIARADQLRNDPQPHEDPAAIYREIVRLFPTTGSAAEARLRLAELNPSEPPGGA